MLNELRPGYKSPNRKNLGGSLDKISEQIDLKMTVDLFFIR